MRDWASLRRAGLFVLALGNAFAFGAQATGPQSVPIGSDHVRRFFDEHCIDCHGKETAKAGLRLDTLADDFRAPDSARRWIKVFERVETGEMPPKKRERPPKEERQRALAWIADRLVDAERRERPAAGTVGLRRLTRLQYETTVRELLAVDSELKERLPEDPRRLGFDNVGEALQLSSAQMEAYLEAADEALDDAFVRGPQPLSQKRRKIGLEALGKENEGAALDLEDAAVLFSMNRILPLSLLGSNHQTGRYRVRASVYGYQSGGKPIEFAATIHRADGSPILIGYFDAPPDSPAVVEFECRVDSRDWIECKPYHFPTAPGGNKSLAEYRGPGLAVQWIETEGPLGEWPPASHARLFGDLPLRAPKAAGQRLPVVSADPKADTERLLRGFLRKAYRRAVTPEELRPFLELARRQLDAGQEFEGALRAAYKAILCSPDFLFFQDKRGARDEFALAARLSYFLWNTTPDEELLTLAEQGTLSRPLVLRDQVERLLKHPKARGFIQNFVAQWLELRLMDATTPDRKLYPEFDLALRESMKAETELFFGELLRRDLSVTNVVDSQFSFLNERLARHYGIDGVAGSTLRLVTLPPGSHRGGVLTQASVLKVTANGTTTSPVYRGVWVLRNILGRPPDPPPPNAGAIEPDIRGAKTIREQLGKHREAAICASCHVRIDPPGFALENFDVIGGWRTNYRVISGPNSTLKKDGPKVEVDAALPDGRTFKEIDELKKLMLEDKNQLARCLAEKLLVYSTGRVPRFSDRAVIEDIVARIQSRNYGLRSLIHEVVQSRTFLNP